MESEDFTNDELVAERKRAQRYAKLCDTAGEADSSVHYWSVIRAIEAEMLNRGMEL
jgi:hypothetical protein